MVCRRSSVGDVDTRRVPYDDGKVLVAVRLLALVGARVIAQQPEKLQMTMMSRVAEVKARDAVVVVDEVACTNTRNTRVLQVLND